MTLGNKYGVDPGRLQGQKDIVEYFKDLDKRVGSSETSLRIGNTSIEDGDLIIRNGDIIVSESDGVVVMRILHGAFPEIRFFPLGENDTHCGSLFGYDSNQVFGEEPDQTIQLYVAKVSNLDPDGGKLLLSREFATLIHHPDTGNESFLQLNAQSVVSTEVALYRGRWSDQQQYDSNMGLYMGAFTATSGFTTWTHTYFTPFSTAIIPLFTVGVNGTTIQWGIDNYSTSSFIIRFSTTTGNKFVTFWNFRL